MCFDLLGRQCIQKHGPESWEAINRLASFIDADRLTDRQLKLSDPEYALCTRVHSATSRSESWMRPDQSNSSPS